MGLILWRSLSIASICSPRWQGNSVFSPDPNHSPDVDQLYPLTYPMHVVNSSTLHNIKVRETKTPKRGPELHRHCDLGE